MQFTETIGRKSAFTVLVVEDDPDSALSLKQTIDGLRLPCHALVATSCAQALAEMQRCPVDALLVDFHLPDGDGLDFIARAQALEPGLPTLLMTGFATGPMAEKA